MYGQITIYPYILKNAKKQSFQLSSFLKTINILSSSFEDFSNYEKLTFNSSCNTWHELCQFGAEVRLYRLRVHPE